MIENNPVLLGRCCGPFGRRDYGPKLGRVTWAMVRSCHHLEAEAKRLATDRGIVHRICGQLCGQPGCRHPQAAQIQALHQIA